jgi:mannose-1-phosphate guanylyltransferase
MKAVILAGGRGTRLRPYTMVLPKPLIPIGNQPVLELLVKRLRKFGFSEIIITTGYLGSLIKALCGDGSRWGVKISYTDEKEPLGTIGPLTLIDGHLKGTFLVTNGDIVTDLDFRKFVEFHKEKGGIATIATFRKRVKLDLGVIECNELHRIVGFSEKPEKEYLVSMGAYLFEPEILDYVPRNIPFGFDDLMHTLISHNVPVCSYIHNGYWLDIGRKEDFKKAQKEFNLYRERILGD